MQRENVRWAVKEEDSMKLLLYPFSVWPFVYFPHFIYGLWGMETLDVVGEYRWSLSLFNGSLNYYSC